MQKDNILVIGVDEVDQNFAESYRILNSRLNQPGALDYDNYLNFRERLNRSFTIGATYDLKVNAASWRPAQVLIQQPIKLMELNKN